MTDQNWCAIYFVSQGTSGHHKRACNETMDALMHMMNDLNATATDELVADQTLANQTGLALPQVAPRTSLAADRTHAMQSSRDKPGEYNLVALPPRVACMRSRTRHNKAVGEGIQQAMLARGSSEYRAVIGQMLHAEAMAHAATDDPRIKEAGKRAAAAANPGVRGRASRPSRRTRPQSAY